MKEIKRTTKDLQNRLAAFEGSSLADRADAFGSLRAVIGALEGWDQNGLKSLASEIVRRSGSSCRSLQRHLAVSRRDRAVSGRDG